MILLGVSVKREDCGSSVVSSWSSVQRGMQPRLRSDLVVIAISNNLSNASSKWKWCQMRLHTDHMTCYHKVSEQEASAYLLMHGSHRLHQSLLRSYLTIHSLSHYYNSTLQWLQNTLELKDTASSSNVYASAHGAPGHTVIMTSPFDPKNWRIHHCSKHINTESLEKFSLVIFKISCYKAKKCTVHAGSTMTLNFDLLTPKVDAFTFVPKCTTAESLVKIHQIFFKILC